jgi:hypothetical protein
MRDFRDRFVLALVYLTDGKNSAGFQFEIWYPGAVFTARSEIPETLCEELVLIHNE